MMKTVVLSGLAALVIAGAGIAGAATDSPPGQPPDGPPGMAGHWGHGHRHGMGMGGFGMMGGLWGGPEMKKEIDTNGDGKIERSELQAFLNKRFDEIDTNHDGKLSQGEIQAWRQAEKARREQAAFNRMDTNGDGGISKDESIGKVLAHFDQIDTNHDGVISPDEMKAAHQAMMQKWKDRGGRDDGQQQ
jgi:Ca2+-binding EF-hand superfamily protein